MQPLLQTFIYTHMTNYPKRTPRKAIVDRLSRAEGQIRALKLVIENEDTENCKEFISQVKAVRSALSQASKEYILIHLQTCQKLPLKEREAHITEAVRLLSNE